MAQLHTLSDGELRSKLEDAERSLRICLDAQPDYAREEIADHGLHALAKEARKYRRLADEAARRGSWPAGMADLRGTAEGILQEHRGRIVRHLLGAERYEGGCIGPFFLTVVCLLGGGLVVQWLLMR
jgi:hypothetical protein